MASSMKMSMMLFFACFLFSQRTLAEVVCENLSTKECSFAIASSGKRCVLENMRNEEGKLDFICTTSEVVVERLSGYIENDECVDRCGVDRGFVGISSDALLSSDFISSLCSPACYQNCPNIVDLYFNLAAGEGVFLPTLCEKQTSNPHRAMMALLSSGGVTAPAPVASGIRAKAPAPASGIRAKAPAPTSGIRAKAPAPAASGIHAKAPAASPF